MMIKLEQMELVLKLGREATQQKFSELSDLHKQAVMVLCEQLPAKLVAGKLEYDAKAKESSLAGSFMKIRQALSVTPGSRKGMGYGSNTLQVFMDEPWPDFIETSWADAINSFPSNKVPKKDCKFSHLPLITTEGIEKSKEPSVVDIARALAEVTVRLIRNIDMPTNLDAIHKVCLMNEEQFLNIARGVGQESAYTIMTKHRPERNVVATVMKEGVQVEIKKFQIPPGHIPFEGFKGSFLANYIALAYQGKYLKPEK